jgi:sensor histidine kinase regulating citrate/malate metabolism
MTPQQLKRMAGIIVVTLLALGLLGWLVVSSVERQMTNGKAPDARTTALNAANELLVAAQAHPTGTITDSGLQSYLWVSEKCWNFLQDAMRQSSGQYTITITSYYNSDDDPNRIRDTIEVFMKVAFSNRRQGEILFSQGGLTGCRETSSQ